MQPVRCDRLSFAYPHQNRQVLRNVSFEIGSGEICGIVGASGSGKSTLLRILAGLLPSCADGNDTRKVTIGSHRPEQARQAGQIGFVFQDLKLLPFLSVRDNLFWASRQLQKQVSTVDENIERVLTLVGLSQWADAPLKNLSGGMKARLALARALLSNPELLLLDEALASLDIGWRIHLHDELARLRAEFGLTIVMISHDLEDIARIADRVIVLSHGGEVAGIIAGELEHGKKIEMMSNLILSDHPSRSHNAQ